jgi:hypothetical protein
LRSLSACDPHHKPSLQPLADADNTQCAAAQPTSSPKAFGISALKETRAAQREGVTRSDPVSLTRSVQSTTQPTQPPPVTISLLSRDVLSPQALQATGENIFLELPKPADRTERDEPSINLVVPSGDEGAITPRAQEIDRTSFSVQPSTKLVTFSPPSSASDSSSLCRMAPALTKTVSSRMHTSRGSLSDEDESQAQSLGASLELTFNRGEERRMAPGSRKTARYRTMSDVGYDFGLTLGDDQISKLSFSTRRRANTAYTKSSGASP